MPQLLPHASKSSPFRVSAKGPKKELEAPEVHVCVECKFSMLARSECPQQVGNYLCKARVRTLTSTIDHLVIRHNYRTYLPCVDRREANQVEIGDDKVPSPTCPDYVPKVRKKWADYSGFLPLQLMLLSALTSALVALLLS